MSFRGPAKTTDIYYAWYEFYPNPMVEITSVPIAPGDIISASVTYSSSSNEFTVTITDETSGLSFSTSATVASAQRSSAEWIAEAPSSSRGVLPLADFGTAYYGSDYTAVANTCFATVGSNTGSIYSFGSSVQTITMAYETISRGHTTIVPKATPSALTLDGTSFSVAWDSTGSSVGLAFSR
jgi:hypothetical protein